VSLSVNQHTAMIAGLAVALLLGGVANGVLPSMWQLASSHPLFWLDQLSYTRSVTLTEHGMQHVIATAIGCHNLCGTVKVFVSQHCPQPPVAACACYPMLPHNPTARVTHRHHAHATTICRWGLQALYISWLIPAPAVQAPATATFLSGLGFCGLDTGLLQALKGRNSGWDAAGSSGG
jgi:hypothetical protein